MATGRPHRGLISTEGSPRRDAAGDIAPSVWQFARRGSQIDTIRVKEHAVSISVSKVQKSSYFPGGVRSCPRPMIV